MTDLATIAGELYGLDLDAFTAERNRRAAALRAEDRPLADAVTALPKPSASAWLVDQIVRAVPDVVAEALALGPGLRAAQASFDRDALRELGRSRRDALSALADAARQVSAQRGRPLSSSVADEVEQTFLAGITDEAAGAAVRSGRLVRALQTVGGEAVDLEGAVAAPGEELAERGAAARPRRTATKAAAAGPDRAAKARSDLAAARTQAQAARAALGEADDELAAAADRHEQLVGKRDAALAEAERLEREVGDAERRRREAIRDRDRANRRAEGADRVVARAETRVEELGSGKAKS